MFQPLVGGSNSMLRVCGALQISRAFVGGPTTISKYICGVSYKYFEIFEYLWGVLQIFRNICRGGYKIRGSYKYFAGVPEIFVGGVLQIFRNICRTPPTNISGTPAKYL